MEDARSFATNIVGAAIALVGVSFLLGGIALLLTGTGAGLLGGGFAALLGLLVLIGAWMFLLVPTKIDELEEEQSVSVKED